MMAHAPVPGIATVNGKGGFDSLNGERALKARFGVATLDGLGSPTRSELAAAGGLLAYLDATQKDAGVLLGAPRRIARPTHGGLDPATRDSLDHAREVRYATAHPARRDRQLRRTRSGESPLRGHIAAAHTKERDRCAP